jgi:Rieske Fe-S protein
MEPTPTPPVKKKSRHLGLIFGGLIFVGIVAVAASGGSNTYQNSATVSPSTQTAIQAQQVLAQQNDTLSNDNSYVNSDGNTVHSPAYSNSDTIPAGASAKCKDGKYSFSKHRSGTCSHHGGVAKWL